MQKEQKIQDIEYEFPYHYVPRFRDGYIGHYNWLWSMKYISVVDWVLDKLGKENFDSITDVGCGDGRLSRELTASFADKRVLGIDYSDKAITLAKCMNPGINYKCVDIIAEKDLDRSDIITLIEVFEHIPLDNCADFVEALSRMLGDKGQIFMTVPHKNKPLNKKHFQHFTFDSLDKYFGKYFEAEEIIYIEDMGLKSLFLHRVLSNSFFVLNNQKMLDRLYAYYKKNLLITSEPRCGRLFVRYRKKNNG